MIRRIVIVLGVILVLLWTFVPLYFLVVVSLRKIGAEVIGYELPSSFTLEHFKEVIWGAEAIGPYLWNSVIVAGIVMVVALCLSLLGGYGLSRWNSAASRGIYSLFFILRMIPPVALVIPYFSIFVKLRLLDAQLALVIIYLPLSIPLGIWLMKGFFDTIPRELEEAARVDGATPWQAFWLVIVPIIVPSAIVTGLFIFLMCFIEYMYAMTLTSVRAVTFPVYIAGFIGAYQIYVEKMLAASLIGVMPMIILYLVIQRHIARGMTLGMVK